MADDVTLGEVVRRIDSIHDELRHMGGSFVRAELYESQRQENGRRIGDIEKEVSDVKSARDADKLEADRRFRTSVNLFIAGGVSLFGGAVLLLLQLVAK